MTIILATKYKEGIIVGCDTVSFTEDKGRIVPDGHTYKFRQIAHFPVGMGVSGDNLNEGIFEEVKVRLMERGKFIDMSRFAGYTNLEHAQEPRVLDRIRRFTRDRRGDREGAVFGLESRNGFIFTIGNELRTGDNEENCQTSECDFAGIGFGYYDGVRRMMEEGYFAGIQRDNAIKLIRGGGFSRRKIKLGRFCKIFAWTCYRRIWYD